MALTFIQHLLEMAPGSNNISNQMAQVVAFLDDENLQELSPSEERMVSKFLMDGKDPGDIVDFVMFNRDESGGFDEEEETKMPADRERDRGLTNMLDQHDAIKSKKRENQYLSRASRRLYTGTKDRQ